MIAKGSDYDALVQRHEEYYRSLEEFQEALVYVSLIILNLNQVKSILLVYMHLQIQLVQVLKDLLV